MTGSAVKCGICPHKIAVVRNSLNLA